MNPRLSISNSEWRIMQLVWQLEPVTSAEIADCLGECHDWTNAMVKTLLHRLVRKGAVNFQRKGKRYLYRANVDQEQCLEQFSDQMLNTLFDGRPIPMLEYLVRTARLSRGEIDQLKQLLADLQQQLPGTPDPVYRSRHD